MTTRALNWLVLDSNLCMNNTTQQQRVNFAFQPMHVRTWFSRCTPSLARNRKGNCKSSISGWLHLWLYIHTSLRPYLPSSHVCIPPSPHFLESSNSTFSAFLLTSIATFFTFTIPSFHILFQRKKRSSYSSFPSCKLRISRSNINKAGFLSPWKSFINSIKLQFALLTIKRYRFDLLFNFPTQTLRCFSSDLEK